MSTPNASRPMPCVVQIGFAGARCLADNGLLHAEFCQQVQGYLAKQIYGLHADLHLSSQHFLCGISQIAAGADTIFTRTCQALSIPQWIMLPQPVNDYLSAQGTRGPDFSEAQKQQAEELLQSPHIIYIEQVSHASERHERFEEVNLEIARSSDVVICLLPHTPDGKPGGTSHLLDLAKKRGLPTLEIRVAQQDGNAVFTSTWHNTADYRPPELPSELPLAPKALHQDEPAIPTIHDYVTALKEQASSQARWRQRLFRNAAVLILLAHLLATLAATSVLAFHSPAHHEPSPAPSLWYWFLATELGLLTFGFLVHQYLHHSRAASAWALARLVAEITRSLRCIGPLHVPLQHLFLLPLPNRLLPLLRTLNVLHLRSTRLLRTEDWTTLRQRYISNRLDRPPNGQVPFYQRAQASARRHLAFGNRTFLACSFSAIVATAGKLALLPGSQHSDVMAFLSATLGLCAIVLPVLAIAALSYCAAMDFAARIHTFAEALEFLTEQRPLLETTASRIEFLKLLSETELRLLGETANWYSRRTFISVA